jgi:hypothetical protein
MGVLGLLDHADFRRLADADAKNVGKEPGDTLI